MSVGYWHTCAIKGSAQCWGVNVYGMLGDGSSVSKSKPAPVTGLASGVTNLTLGDWHSCAIVNGSAKCWGQNTNGQLGDASTTVSRIPVQVSGLTSGIAGLAAGAAHTCAMTTDGAMKCWGSNVKGPLGDGSTTSSLSPVDVQGAK